MVARKFKILSKRTVRGSALVTLSDTKRGFTVPRGEQRCMETATFVNFERVYSICCFCLYNTKLILSTRHDFIL